jgi:hypothetical protein
MRAPHGQGAGSNGSTGTEMGSTNNRASNSSSSSSSVHVNIHESSDTSHPNNTTMDTLEGKSLLYKLYYSKRMRMLYGVCVFIIGFSADSGSGETSSYLITGGVIGLISALVVMWLCWHRYSDFQLLFWRSFADFGVALRFVLTTPLNRLSCHAENCFTNGKLYTYFLEYLLF